MIIPYVAPVAQNELYALRDVLAEGNDAKLQSWILQQAMRTPTKGRSFLAALALTVAENLRRAVPQADFFHARLDDGAPPAVVMGGRLVTATMNDDRRTVDALVSTAERWPAADRRKVVEELVRILQRVTAT